MKDQILKIAKVKSEKEFYKKYPTEEAFMKAHGNKLKKAAMGTAMVKRQLEQLTDFGNPPVAQNGAFKPLNFNDMLSGAQATNLGMSKADYLEGRKSGKIADPMAAPKQSDGLSNFISMAGDIAGAAMGGGEGDDGDGLKAPSEVTNAAGEYGTGVDTRFGSLIGFKNGGYVTIPKADFGAIAGALKGLGEQSGGIGNMLGNVLNKKGGGAKGIMNAVGPNGLLGKGGPGLKSLGTKSGLGAAGKAAGLGVLNAAPDILNGIGQMKEQKNQIAKADQSAQVSGLVKQANTNNPVEIQKQNIRRIEDDLVQPGELGAPKGTGTNFLQMRAGGEIQNTYAPGYLYDDLGYEPLEQYRQGGDIPEAAFGDYFQSSGQASIGKGVGSAIGNVFGGPLGGAIGGAIGGFVGHNVFGGKKDADKLAGLQAQTQKNTMETAGAQMLSGIRGNFGSFMEDGGYVSHNWQPQVITKFGDYSVKDLLKADATMNTLRSGGHLAQVGYTAPSAEAMFTGKAQYGKWMKRSNEPGVEVPTGPIDRTPQDTYIKSYSELNDRTTTNNNKQDYKQDLIRSIYSKNMTAGQPADETYMYGKGDGNKYSEFSRIAPEGGEAINTLKRTEERRPFLNLIGKKQIMDRYDKLDETKAQGYLQEMSKAIPGGLPNMEDGGYMAMGGNLQTHWGGRPELMSYNPYIPGGGETVMFRGQSHDETNGKGQSGIGITYGDSPVEVERGEPMTEMNDGGVVFGNMKIDQFAADQINDPKAKGKKYKNYVADLSKTEAKQNKILDKASKRAATANNNDILEMNSINADYIGATMNLKNIAKKKLDAAAVQNAILETAEERGLESDALSQGKIKQAKFGTNVKKAQNGKFAGGPLTAEQIAKAQGPGGTLYEGAKHYVTERGQLPLFARMLGAKPKPHYFNPELTNTLMNADDRSYSVDRPINPELSSQLMYGTRNFTNYNPDLTNSLMYGSPYIQPQSAAPSATVAVVNAKNPQAATTDNATGPVSVTTAKTSGSKGGSAKSKAKSSKSTEQPTSKNTYNLSTDPILTYVDQSSEGFYDPITHEYVTDMGYPSIEKDLNDRILNKKISPSDLSKVEAIGKSMVQPKKPEKTNWAEIGQAALSNLAPLLRPTDQEPLDPAQLYPEMLALATNQVDPVQAQKFQPLLQGAPSDISYQDQLNEITAQSRAAERMSQYNPEAAAAIFANVSQAKNKVLAEQFRANQLRKEEVYAQNRQRLDQAQMQNLQLLDQQYVRQQQAKSNTKAQALEAMKSIADKTAKNKLENRQLGVMENLYKYRFDNQGRAINFNDPYQFNNPTVGSTTPSGNLSSLSEYERAKALTNAYEAKIKNDTKAPKSKNGSIVKAIKNL